ncbi:MAG TPA: hypothetical protein VGL81_07260 [Polyangiaceae bacterium]|jgi:phage terminase Nu1 subunit (DNA packaging protein)
MASESSILLVNIQLALQISQRELGALIGRTKRTIQRWQGKGTAMLDEDQAKVLAAHLRPVRPDLADEVLECAFRAS